MKTSFEKIKEVNPTKNINHIESREFEKYGKILKSISCDYFKNTMELFPIPKEFNQYVASDSALENAKIKKKYLRIYMEVWKYRLDIVMGKIVT